MCQLCDGYSEAQVIDGHLERIDTKGWTGVGVEAPIPWVYTVGLSWSLDHPELVISHPSMRKLGDLLGHLTDEITSGRQFGTTSLLETPSEGTVRFGSVHARNRCGEWFAWWPTIAAAAGETPHLRSAIQPIVGCDCLDCRAQPLLHRRCHPGIAPQQRRGRQRR